MTGGERDDASRPCKHSFQQSTSAILQGMHGARVCILCNRLEVRIERTGMWATVEEFRQAMLDE